MAYTEVQDLGTDTVIALGGFNKKARKDNPTSIEGYYLGSRSVSSPKSKTGLAKIHVFQTPKGNVGVWGKTDLDQKLGAVTPGTMTLAKFDRMVPSKNGEMYRYKVLVDNDNTIEVQAGATEAATETSDYSAEEVSYERDETDTNTQDADDIASAAELARLERQAKVQALVGKRKTT